MWACRCVFGQHSCSWPEPQEAQNTQQAAPYSSRPSQTRAQQVQQQEGKERGLPIILAFSIAVIKYGNQGNLQKEELNLAYGSSG